MPEGNRRHAVYIFLHFPVPPVLSAQSFSTGSASRAAFSDSFFTFHFGGVVTLIMVEANILLDNVNMHQGDMGTTKAIALTGDSNHLQAKGGGINAGEGYRTSVSDITGSFVE